MNPGLTAEAAAQLQEGINLVLSRWAALRMAVENEWGGRDSLQKSQQLGHQLFHRLTQSKKKVYIDDIEDMLDEFMLSLNTEIEDGSINEIAEKLMVMQEECLEGDFDSIKRLKETNTPSVSYNRQAGSNDDDNGDNDDDTGQKGSMANEHSSKQVPEVVDGWTVVASKRSRGRQN
ncbi:hypothetical protein Salat_2352100 [Sesamum alatum]|uniref:Pre-rRNA-processing protein TSR2 n=1 Tax=Sesamum alatum TaxID=300844 RepID=A0AAE1XWR7_9LAMI|nr:hypothetical protein Salat_2352100 [Sesamum alatum]